ncbi:MAG: hypothetical protein K6F00_11995, partial [Lachnospiraceae bacterium]|nr:hypothetical protein [Lachnospiraceae bacterium]
MLHEVLVDKNNLDVFTPLIPGIFMEELERGKLFCVATFDGVIETGKLVGIVLVRVKYQWQEIAWVALTKNYGITEYGSDIVWNRVEAARAIGLLQGTFSEYPKEERLKEDYFTYANFDIETIPGHIFSVNAFDLKREEDLLSEEEARHCFQLRYITDEQKSDFEKAVLNSRVPSPIEYPVEWEKYDPDMSMIYEKEGSIKAVILVIRSSKYYSFEGVFGNDPIAFMSLFLYLRRLARENLSDEDILIIPAITDELDKGLSGSPIAKRNELQLAYKGYEQLKKRKKATKEDVRKYNEAGDKFKLGLEELDICERIKKINIEADGIGSNEYYFGRRRRREAVYDRHWAKTEESCVRIGLNPGFFIFHMIAKNAYRIYKSGNAKVVKVRGNEFLLHPVTTVKQKQAMEQRAADLLVTCEKMKSDLESGKKPETIFEIAKYEADKELYESLLDVLEAMFVIVGVNIKTGEQITEKDRVNVILSLRKVTQRYSRNVLEYDDVVLEKIIDLFKETPEYNAMVENSSDI